MIPCHTFTAVVMVTLPLIGIILQLHAGSVLYLALNKFVLWRVIPFLLMFMFPVHGNGGLICLVDFRWLLCGKSESHWRVSRTEKEKGPWNSPVEWTVSGKRNLKLFDIYCCRFYCMYPHFFVFLLFIYFFLFYHSGNYICIFLWYHVLWYFSFLVIKN